MSKKTLKAIIIDPVSSQVIQVQLEDDLKNYQDAVGGFITIGYRLPNGDLVLVDEEGMRKPQTHGFYMEDAGGVFVGRGLVVGQHGENFTSAKSTVQDILDITVYTPVTRRA